jgi:hypothetical protein
MALVRRMVANPVRSAVSITPIKRRKHMATKRRKRSTKRRVVHRAHTSNRARPVRRHTKRRGRRSAVYARRRNPINPIHHRRHHMRHRRRRSNPLAGAGSEIINYTVAGLAQGMAMPIVGGFVGRFLPFGAFNQPIITAGTGWLLSKAFGMFGFTRRFSHPALVFGFAAAAMQVLQPIVARTIGGGAPANPTMSGWGNGYYRRGMPMRGPAPMRGIGVVTDIPPRITAPPPAMNDRRGMMSGMGMRPGTYQY